MIRSSIGPHKEYYIVATYNCEEDKDICPAPRDTPDHPADIYPKVILYIPEGLNTETGLPIVHTTEIQGAVDTPDISNILINELPFLGTRLSNKGFETFDGESCTKAVFVSEEHKVPHFWKGLSAKYIERIAFAYVHFDDDMKVSKKKLGVKSPPGIVVLLPEGDKVHYPADAAYNFESVDKFLAQYVPDHKHRILFRKPHDAYEKVHKFHEVNSHEGTYEEKLELWHKKSQNLGSQMERHKKQAESHKKKEEKHKDL